MKSRRPVGRFFTLTLFAFCVVSACTPVRQQGVFSHQESDYAAMLLRMQRVAFPLLLASAEWCPFDQEPIYGFVLQNQPVSPVEGGTQEERRLIVTRVYDRSPAGTAGLQIGDQVLEVNTKDVSKDPAESATDLVSRLTRSKIRPLQLDVVRSGQRVLVYLDPVPACQFGLGFFRTDAINALSNGRQIGVTTGLMGFVRSDSELAWVLAHEIAHNVLGHVPEAKLRAMLDAWLGATLGEAPQPAPSLRSIEVQADYLAAYLMARAGYDLQAVRTFWRRLGQVELQQADIAPGLDQSHPTTEERIQAFEVTLKEIEAKLARGEALNPVVGLP